ncbi:hypothetical protein BV22DRAFT_613623 [Leucogyrophana mollusca]|uniref:Uncharacterized protein n=1 Tax=Leucogyrophana mollusca TaxID=85980 RepID=A0ACB8BBL1_9AGAM|nr:hypothetical protein BV22DRAFT_613623 [Leucogyrophana mollusca]
MWQCSLRPTVMHLWPHRYGGNQDPWGGCTCDTNQTILRPREQCPERREFHVVLGLQGRRYAYPWASHREHYIPALIMTQRRLVLWGMHPMQSGLTGKACAAETDRFHRIKGELLVNRMRVTTVKSKNIAICKSLFC